MPKKKRRETARTAVTVAATGIGAIADVAAGGTGIVGGAAAGALLVFEGIWERQKRRGERMLRAAFDVPDEQFADVIREKMKDARTRDALLEAMRAALEAMSDEVMPALGRLIREYERAGVSRDGFFRGCCRVLQDLLPDEYASLAALLARIDSPALKSDVRTGEVWIKDGTDYAQKHVDGVPASGPYVLVRSQISGGGSSLGVPGCNPAHAPRLFHLLDREGFGRRKTERRVQEETFLAIELETIRRLARLLT